LYFNPHGRPTSLAKLWENMSMVGERLWGRRDSNPHALLHMILSHARLPIPTLPPTLDRIAYTDARAEEKRRGRLSPFSHDMHSLSVVSNKVSGVRSALGGDAVGAPRAGPPHGPGER